MTEIKTVRLGDILIDENLFTVCCGLTTAVMNWPSTKKNERSIDLIGDLLWFLIRRLKFEKNTTPEGHSSWVLTIDCPRPAVTS